MRTLVRDDVQDRRLVHMQIGVIFSQADSGTDPEAIRAWVRTAET